MTETEVKPRKAQKRNNSTAASYLSGDLVMMLMWGAYLGSVIFLSSLTSYWLLPVFLYLNLCTLALILPKPSEGYHKIPSSEAVKWFISSYQFGRLWGFPPIKHFIFSFTSLRTFFLWCCGAKVSVNTGWSTIGTVSDPCMLEVGPRTMIGVECLISGHTIVNNRLLLRKIIIKEGALISARCALGPGIEIGEDAILEGGVEVSPGTVIPKGAYISKKSTLHHKMKLEAEMHYPPFMR